MASESISTVAYIGHGSLSAVRHYEGSRNQSLAWYDFAAMSGPLKTGVFEQRTCAQAHDDKQVRIPVGTFVMQEPSHVYAAVGSYFPNSADFTAFDDAVHSAYPVGAISSDQLLQPVRKD